MKYDEYMDKECIELCDAINSIDGLETTQSCCGHGKDSFQIWFKAKNVKNLLTIARITDIRYSQIPHDWKCMVEDVDIDTGVRFLLYSGTARGKKAYEEASILANNIYQHLEHTEYMKWYNSI